jgi:hypothetical protein
MIFEDGQVHPKRPLSYALVLASGLAVGVSHAGLIWYAYVLNILFWMMTAILLFRTLNIYLDRRTSIIGVVLFGLCVGNLANLNSALSESLTTMFFMLGIHFLCANEVKGRLSTGLTYVTGVLFIVATIRPGAWYLAILSLLILIVLMLVTKQKIRSRALLFLSTGLLIVIVNMGLFKAQYGQTAISLIDKYTWYPYIGAQVDAEINGMELSDTKAARHEFLKKAGPTEELVQEVKADMKSGLSNNISVVIKMAFRNICENLTAQSSPITSLIKLEGISTLRILLLKASGYQNLLLSLGGLLAALILLLRTRRFSLLIILILIGYTVGTSGVSFWQGDRFHIVFYPLSILVILLLFSELRKTNLRTA